MGALGAGLAMFPLLFTGGLEVGQGPGMMFVTLPLAFGQMPGGLLFGTLFFVLVVCALDGSPALLLQGSGGTGVVCGPLVGLVQGQLVARQRFTVGCLGCGFPVPTSQFAGVSFWIVIFFSLQNH